MQFYEISKYFTAIIFFLYLYNINSSFFSYLHESKHEQIQHKKSQKEFKHLQKLTQKHDSEILIQKLVF